MAVFCAQPVHRRQDVWALDQPTLQGKLPWVVHDHQTDQQHDQPLAGEEQHKQPGNHVHGAEQILDTNDEQPDQRMTRTGRQAVSVWVRKIVTGIRVTNTGASTSPAIRLTIETATSQQAW